MQLPILPQTPSTTKTFLWGALFGAITGACIELWALRKQWSKAKEAGRDEERLKLEGEIAAQRKETEQRRREADARRWELEEMQSENQRLKWELRRAKEKNS
jgi:hypothetical protein